MRARATLFLALAVCVPMPTSGEAPREVRAPVWVYFESVPGQSAALPPRKELSDSARFVVGGMVYGWKFSYVPSDATRGVAEFFELSPVAEIAPNDPRFTLEDVAPTYPRLNCWAVFTLDDSVKRWVTYWASVNIPNGRGRGRANRDEESEGIRKAYEAAIRDSIRSYARTQEKNKPKEILGEVLLKNAPRLFADEGYFVADVQTLINIEEMVPYREF